MPAQIKKEFKQLKLRFIQAIDLPKMDMFGTIDAYIFLEFLGREYKTQVVKADEAKVCAVLFFLATAELAIVDLLCEGKYAEMMVKHPETGADLVTWVWLSYHIGTLIGSALTGPMADYVSPRAVFWVALPLAAQILIPTLSGALMGEFSSLITTEGNHLTTMRSWLKQRKGCPRANVA